MTTIAGPQIEPRTTEPQAHREAPAGSEHAAIARQGMAGRSRARVERAALRVSGALQRPVLGASVAGGLVAAAAGLWGPTEAALGAFVGVLAYRMLKKRRAKLARTQAA